MACSHENTVQLVQYGDTRLLACESCGLVRSSRYDSESWNKALYEEYYKNEMAAGRFRFGTEIIIRLFRLFRAFKIYTITPRSKSILDIGSGRGFTLYFLKKYFSYQRVVGTQISPAAVEFSRNVLGLEIWDRDLLDIPFKAGSFAVVTLWHVLEHVLQPGEYVERIHELLADGGTLIIEVPNFDSWTRRLTGRYWLGLDLDYHLSFFTPDSLCALLEANGFRIRRVHTFSLEYSTFISAQSLISRLTRTDHVFFAWLQSPNKNPELLLHLFLFFILTIPCFLINLLLYFSRRGEVLCVIAEKTQGPPQEHAAPSDEAK